MLSRALALAAVLAFTALAAVPAVAAGPSSTYFDVAKVPAPPVSGKEIADNLAAFSTAYNNRVGGTPQEIAAANFLRDEAEKLGYKTEIQNVAVADGDPGTVGRLVHATRPGTSKPGEHLIFVGHYDTVPQTIYGAYDNGSGTTMLRAIAKSLSQIPTNRTVDIVWYSNEEEGLLASEAHAKAWQAEKRGAVRAVFGFDMVGIAYPVAKPGPKNCLCFWHGDEDEGLEPLLRHIHFDVLGFPDAEGLVQFRGVNARNSDERSWDVLGYPVVRWAGKVAAADYPAYHDPRDTMDTIDTEAGGRSFFEQGLRNTLVAAYDTALTLDNEQPVARATTSGNGPVSFDATSSSDADGPLSRFAWDFGDGTTATGPKVTHAYASAGSYTARLTVGDNMWAPVTSTITVPVIVATAASKPAVKKAKRCRKGYKRVTKKVRGKRVSRCVKIKRKRR